MWPFRSLSGQVVPTVATDTKSITPSGSSIPDDWLLELFGATTATSIAVSASVAMTVPACSNAVKVISESCATMALTVKRKVGDQETDVPDFPALALLTGQANEWTSGYELIRDLVSQALSQDAGGLAYINRVNGRPVEIIRYNDGGIMVE